MTRAEGRRVGSAALPASAPAPPAAASDSTSTSDEIAKLAQLRDDGTLTDAEFQAQKAKLLAS